MSRSFIIRQPKWMKNYYTAILCVSGVGILILLLLYLNKLLNLTAFITLGSICLVFFVFGILGIKVYLTEKFYFKNGEYTSEKTFKKTEKARLSEIARVEIKDRKTAFSTVMITFFAKDGRELIKFSADGWIFKNNIFISSLNDNKIRYTLPESFSQKETEEVAKKH